MVTGLRGNGRGGGKDDGDGDGDGAGEGIVDGLFCIFRLCEAGCLSYAGICSVILVQKGFSPMLGVNDKVHMHGICRSNATNY
jgi:hypothetical protein